MNITWPCSVIIFLTCIYKSKLKFECLELKYWLERCAWVFGPIFVQKTKNVKATDILLPFLKVKSPQSCLGGLFDKRLTSILTQVTWTLVDHRPHIISMPWLVRVRAWNSSFQAEHNIVLDPTGHKPYLFRVTLVGFPMGSHHQQLGWSVDWLGPRMLEFDRLNFTDGIYILQIWFFLGQNLYVFLSIF